MNKYYIIIFIAIFCFIFLESCSEKDNEPTRLFDDSKLLQGEVLEKSSSNLNSPLQLTYKDSFLIVMDRFSLNGGEYLFRLLGEEGKKITTFGRIGKGPDEFLFPSFLTSADKNKVDVYNAKLFTLNILDYDSILAGGKNLTIDSYSKLNTGYSKLVRVKDNLLFGSGFFKKGRYLLSDTLGNTIKEIGAYPFESEFDVSKRVLGMAFQTNLQKHPQKPLIVSATSKSPNLEILNLDDSNYKIVNKINSIPTKFENKSSETRLDVSIYKNNTFGYQDVTVNKNYIYVLYSGKRMDQRYRYSDKILVFDWKGNPVKYFKLDKELRYISIDDRNENLFGLGTISRNQSVLIKFSLPKF